ncbi:MAG: hypothetical protein PVG78_08860 [Desulfobacterales bacterium]
MDSQFLKFWGNFLLQAAEGQKRLDDLTRWMTAGFSGSEELTDLFREAYGLKKSSPTANASMEEWGKAAARFQKAFADYLALFDAVPRSRFEALREEKGRLERKIDEQSRTIQQLRLELGESRAAEGRVLDGFQQLMKVQNEQFRQVSESMNRFFSGAPAKAGKKGQKAKTPEKS